MRRIHLFFILFFGVTTNSVGQILVGPVIGAQTSWVSFDDDEHKNLYQVKPVNGINGGLSVSFAVRRRFYLHTAFLYSTKGKVIRGEQDELLKNKVRYRFIDIPILYTVDFKAKVSRGKEFKYYIGLGPNIGYWLGGKGSIYTSDFHENGVVEPKSYSISFDEPQGDIMDNRMHVANPNRIQLGLNIAAGAVFEPFGYQKFMVTMRYEFGHSFFSKTSDGQFGGTYYQDILRSRNQGVRLSVAYLINLKIEERKRGKSTIKRKHM